MTEVASYAPDTILSDRPCSQAVQLREPEARLVLQCARVRVDGVARSNLHEALQRPLDWEAVLSYAFHHGILPLVTKHLTRYGDQRVPPEVKARLQQNSRAIALRNLRQAYELAELVAALEAAGVAAIPFKGPVLAETAYGDLSYRSCLDLDLLVPRSEFERAEQVLRDLGYLAWYETHTPAERADFIDITGGYDFFHREKGIQAELHWKFFPSFNAFHFDVDALWARHRQVPFLGGEVRALAPEDMLVYLCVHGTKHHWLKLKWLCDVAEYVRAHPEMDWEEVMRQAGRMNLRRIVRLTLLLLQRAMEVPLPETVQAWSGSDSVARRLAQRVSDSWLVAHPDAPPPTPLDTWWFHFRARERWRDRVPFAVHNLQVAVAPNEKDRAFVRLPRALQAMYLVIRPLRIVRDKRHKPRGGGQPAE